MCKSWVGWWILILAAAGGCTAARVPSSWTGPAGSVAVKVSAWRYNEQVGRQYQTAHYLLLSTVDDPTLMGRIAQVMEGAYQQYLLLVPEVAQTNQPMRCYWFADREQWAQFTRNQTGADSAVYLQILRGGYTLHDVYVAYDLGESGTFAVAAHEGWHQFAARHFRGRLPPFLEEGIACLFENIRWDKDLPRWNLRINRTRVRSLRNAMERGQLWTLQELAQMHAGLVVDQPASRIESFYAQSWAFARFMCEYEDGHYRRRLQRLLEDVATGTVFDPTGSHHHAGGGWDPSGVRPMLEYYLGRRLPTIEEEYREFVRRIVREDEDADISITPSYQSRG